MSEEELINLILIFVYNYLINKRFWCLCPLLQGLIGLHGKPGLDGRDGSIGEKGLKGNLLLIKVLPSLKL